MKRWLTRALAAGLLLGIALTLFAYRQALRPPVVRAAEVAVADWPAGEPPRSVLLVTDTHVAGPDMPPERLARIVARLNALAPDLVLLAGDYVSEKRVATRLYTAGEIVDVLAGLRAPLGVVAVLGNHDHWADPAGFRRAFAARDVPLLANRAVRRGPFVIGGVDDLSTGHADLPGTLRSMAAQGPGVRLLLSHSPDVAPSLTDPVAAVLAGHTHCGQIALPFFGPIITMSRYGRRFACGEIRDGGQRVFVSAGLGTSGLPLRFAAPPDVWLIRFGPAPAE